MDKSSGIMKVKGLGSSKATSTVGVQFAVMHTAFSSLTKQCKV